MIEINEKFEPESEPESEEVPERVTDTEFRDPRDWARDLGTPDFQFAAARQLHGWHVHEHHENAPMLISRAAYEGAIEALSKPRADKDGVMSIRPCREAQSPHLGKGI